MAKNVKGNCTQRQYNERINDKGETVYDALIEIKNSKDLSNYGISWENCERINIGGVESVIVYKFETTDKKLAEFFSSYINTRHSQNCRSTRCMVPGKNGLIVCPGGNKCRCCPYGKKPEDRKPRVINYDDPSKFDEFEHNSCEFENVDAQMDLGIITKILKHQNPLMAKVFNMYASEELSISDIALELDMPERKVRYLKDQATEIANKVLNS